MSIMAMLPFDHFLQSVPAAMVPRVKSEVAIAMIDMLFELNKSLDKVGQQYYNLLNSNEPSSIAAGFENMLKYLGMKKCFDDFCGMIFAWLGVL